MPEASTLHCPIRGALKTRQRAADGLTFTEEKRRIDAIRYLLRKDYPPENFGIETTLLKFGHGGRNSFRVDLSIFEIPADEARGLDTEERLENMHIVGEIKRSNASRQQAVATQVKPALGFLPDLSALGVYWDDVEQRFFYRTVEGSRTKTHEAPISKIPAWGETVESTRLAYEDLVATRNLVDVFDRIEDSLHTYVADKARRYEILLQLLLTKIHDENRHRRNPQSTLDVQDFSVEAVADSVVTRRMNEALARTLGLYQQYLPEAIRDKFDAPAEALRRATQVLAPINILGSRDRVIQTFYMKFARNLYKWDLAQYFTPHEVIDFIVDVVNPQYGEPVKDPACGSADFLTSVFRAVPESRDSLWGSDCSRQAVQVSILNMVLHGDGKTNITEEDSLASFSERRRKHAAVLCNPPFGTRIVERRHEVLQKFDMGYDWERDESGDRLVRTDNVRDSQQVGILFAELCVRITKPGGRVGIILPNGYLGNRSNQYLALREWLLRHAKLVGIVGFPRFTFKTAGADVSASVVFLEKREQPLQKASESTDYPCFFGVLESVGWQVGDKKAKPIHVRDQETGALILNDDNEPILDADFGSVFDEFLRSACPDAFQWLSAGREIPAGAQGWSIPVTDISQEPNLNMDPKRHCFKFRNLREEIMAGDHFRIGDVLDVVAQQPFEIEASAFYRYIEIGKVGAGEYDHETLRGWELPSRAKLTVDEGDILIASIWSSAGKWFMPSGDCTNLLATNGFTRTRLKASQRARLTDLVAGLCSEAFRIQMRGFATGSDGLAEIVPEDLFEIVLPRVTSQAARRKVKAYMDKLLTDDSVLSKAVGYVMERVDGWPSPDQRKSHTSLV